MCYLHATVRLWTWIDHDESWITFVRQTSSVSSNLNVNCLVAYRIMNLKRLPPNCQCFQSSQEIENKRRKFSWIRNVNLLIIKCWRQTEGKGKMCGCLRNDTYGLLMCWVLTPGRLEYFPTLGEQRGQVRAECPHFLVAHSSLNHLHCWPLEKGAIQQPLSLCFTPSRLPPVQQIKNIRCDRSGLPFLCRDLWSSVLKKMECLSLQLVQSNLQSLKKEEKVMLITITVWTIIGELALLLANSGGLHLQHLF